jgi:FkbM family methyltransferase
MLGPIKRAILAAARNAGYEIVPISPVYPPANRRLTMINHHEIDAVVDVGANTGQYACALRQAGYKEEMFSFEPLREAYEDLEKKSHTDSKWHVFHTAIGEENGESEINVAGNSESSSLLPMLDAHLRSAPESQYRTTERVKLSTLDAILEPVLSNQSRVLLKIDTQGYEHHVIKGAKSLLQQVRLIECELSLTPLYEGQYLFQDMLDLLYGIGFTPVYFESVFSDLKTGHCLQVDGTFVRSL